MSAHIVTETAIALVLLVWLVWLTATVAGHHDRIDGAVDVADRALAARQEDEPTDYVALRRHVQKEHPDLSLYLRNDVLDSRHRDICKTTPTDDEPDTRGRHAARPTPGPRDKETAK